VVSRDERLRVTITGTEDRKRQITGLVPGDWRPLWRARHDISATAMRLRFTSPPAGITIRGDLQIGSGVVVDAGGDGPCRSQAGTSSSGTTTLGAGSQVRAGDGGSTIPSGDADVQQGQRVEVFDELTFGASELSALKALARARGTYYQGHVSFDAKRPIPDGLIYVDTVSGRPVTDATPDADLAVVSLGKGASADPGGILRGWIIVNGSLSIGGEVVLEGLASESWAPRWPAARAAPSPGSSRLDRRQDPRWPGAARPDELVAESSSSGGS
jgi:hypothetical protein